MGHETGTDERLLAEAARWHARLAAGDCTDFERAQFQRWRASSRKHADTYDAAAGFSRRLERRADLDARLQAMADEAFAMGANAGWPSSATERDSDLRRGGDLPTGDLRRAGDPRTADPRTGDPRSGDPRSKSNRRWMVPATLAASVIVAFIGVRIGGYFPTQTPPVSYSSADEGRRDVALPDGSLVHLDVDSEISVSFSSGHRDITLVSGRALFAVAHDASRPFVVSAGQSHTTALGTHFQVQREGEHVRVTLTEGSVAVTGNPEQSSWSERLSPGEQVSLSADGRVYEKRAVDTQAATSWSRGRLVFRGTPLADALQEVNRYGHRKVRLGDADLSDLLVDGNFIAGETDLIVSAFAAALPLRIAEGDVGEIILFRRYEADAP
jgi:transmembrane sensor